MADDTDNPSSNEEMSISSEIKEALSDALSFGSGGGSFACFHQDTAPRNPGLCINGFGMIGLPISERDALAIKNHIHRSGSGSASADADTTLCNIPSSQFTFKNELWYFQIEDLVTSLKEKLGVSPSCQVQLVPQSLLLQWGQGTSTFFAPFDHEQVIGRALMVLPCADQGGTVTINLNSEKHCKSIKYAAKSVFSVTSISWYDSPDTRCEVVLSGCHLAILYDLVQSDGRTPVSLLSARDGRTKLEEALQLWNSYLRNSELSGQGGRGPCPKMLGWVLSGRPRAPVKPSHLDKDDPQLLETIMDACADGRYFVCVAHLSMLSSAAVTVDALFDVSSPRSTWMYKLCAVYSNEAGLMRLYKRAVDMVSLSSKDIIQPPYCGLHQSSSTLSDKKLVAEPWLGSKVVVLIPPLEWARCLADIVCLGKADTHLNLEGLLKEFVELKTDRFLLVPLNSDFKDFCQALAERFALQNWSGRLFRTATDPAICKLLDGMIRTGQYDLCDKISMGVTEVSISLFSTLGMAAALQGLKVVEQCLTTLLGRICEFMGLWQALRVFEVSFKTSGQKFSDIDARRFQQLKLSSLKVGLKRIRSTVAGDGEAMGSAVYTFGTEILQELLAVIPSISMASSEVFVFLLKLVNPALVDMIPQGSIGSSFDTLAPFLSKDFSLREPHGSCLEVYWMPTKTDISNARITGAKLRLLVGGYHNLGSLASLKIVTGAILEASKQVQGPLFSDLLTPVLTLLLHDTRSTNLEPWPEEDQAEFFRKIFTTFIRLTVGKEKPDPRNVSFVGCGCDGCVKFQTFVEDPEQIDFYMRENGRIRYHIYELIDAQVFTVDLGSHSLSVEKPQVGDYNRWVIKAQDAVKQISKFANGTRLEALLGVEFQALLGLDAVRSEGNRAKPLQRIEEDKSIVPAKRSYDDTW